mgnify:FL=1
MLERDLSLAWNAKYGRPSWLQIGLLHKGVAFAVVVLLLLGSTGAYAYVSPGVTEGTVFYPVKQVVESVEEATKITPEAKAKFYLKQIKRREAEREIIKKKNPATEIKKEIKDAKVDKIEKTEESIERAEDRLEKAQEVIEKTNSKNKKLREEVKNRLEIRMERRQKQIEKKAEKQKERTEKLEILKAKGRETQKY